MKERERQWERGKEREREGSLINQKRRKYKHTSLELKWIEKPQYREIPKNFEKISFQLYLKKLETRWEWISGKINWWKVTTKEMGIFNLPNSRNTEKSAKELIFPFHNKGVS